MKKIEIRIDIREMNEAVDRTDHSGVQVDEHAGTHPFAVAQGFVLRFFSHAFDAEPGHDDAECKWQEAEPAPFGDLVSLEPEKKEDEREHDIARGENQAVEEGSIHG